MFYAKVQDLFAMSHDGMAGDFGRRACGRARCQPCAVQQYESAPKSAASVRALAHCTVESLNVQSSAVDWILTLWKKLLCSLNFLHGRYLSQPCVLAAVVGQSKYESIKANDIIAWIVSSPSFDPVGSWGGTLAIGL